MFVGWVLLLARVGLTLVLVCFCWWIFILLRVGVILLVCLLNKMFWKCVMGLILVYGLLL